MAPSTTFDEPSEFDVGDRVVTTEALGPLMHRIPRGSRGVVVARTADRLIAVRLETGRVEHVHPSRLEYDDAFG